MTPRGTRAPRRLVPARPSQEEAGTSPTICSAHGAKLRDANGHTWLDGRSGGFGGGHPDVAAAAVRQLDRAAMSSRTLISRPLAGAVTELARFCPAPLDLSYLCNSGAEALDFSLKLAKGRDPRRHSVLALRGEDYGDLSHGSALRRGEDLLPHPPLAASTGEPGALIEMIDADVAAVVAAPAVPGRGLGHLPRSWWRALRRRCADSGTLLVIDERRTAPSRLGHDLAAQATGIVPDVLVLGEALGGDIVPVGATVMSRALYLEVLGDRNATVHGSTFGANPLAAAAVHAVLNAVQSEGLTRRAQEYGAALRDQWVGLKDHPRVANYDVDGLHAWIRFTDPAAAHRARAELFSRRILVGLPEQDDDPILTVTPPLSITEEDLEHLGRATAHALHLSPELDTYDEQSGGES